MPLKYIIFIYIIPQGILNNYKTRMMALMQPINTTNYVTLLIVSLNLSELFVNDFVEDR